MSIDSMIQHIKAIKPKLRTPEQKRQPNTLWTQTQRNNATEEEKEARKEKDKISKQLRRKKEIEMQKEARQEKDKLAKQNQTEEITKAKRK